MIPENAKTLLFVAWAVVVVVAALAAGITSVLNWTAVAGVAVVPPLVARHFWRAPEQTMSESIHQARR